MAIKAKEQYKNTGQTADTFLTIEPTPPAAAAKPGTSPKAAVAKAQAEVSEVAKNEGMRPAKEVKTELIQRIEQAIEESKLNKPDKPAFVTIEIPGDGTFKIGNTPEQLGEVLKRAKKLNTQSSANAKVPSNPSQKSQRTKLSTEFQLPDDITSKEAARGVEQSSIFESMVERFQDSDELPIFTRTEPQGTERNDFLASLQVAMGGATPDSYGSKNKTVGEARAWLKTRQRQLESLAKQSEPTPPAALNVSAPATGKDLEAKNKKDLQFGSDSANVLSEDAPENLSGLEQSGNASGGNTDNQGKFSKPGSGVTIKPGSLLPENTRSVRTNTARVKAGDLIKLNDGWYEVEGYTPDPVYRDTGILRVRELGNPSTDRNLLSGRCAVQIPAPSGAPCL